MSTETLNAANESEVSSLSADQIDAISGGVTEGGCVVLPLPIGPVYPIDPIYPIYPIEPVLY